MTVLRTKAGHVAVYEAKGWPLAGATAAWQSPPLVSGQLIGSLIESISYADLYRQQPWVNIVVNKLARGIARLPLKSYRLANEGGDRERVRDHPLTALLNVPYPRCGPFAWKADIVSSLCLHGNALVVKWRPSPGEPPAELWPVPWSYVTVVPGKSEPVDRYEFNGPAGRKFFEPADVIHFKWWAPDSVAGVSPLEPLRRTLALEDAAQRYGISSFANGIRPSGALVTDQKLSGPQKTELGNAVRAANAGPDRAFGMLLLDNGLNWQPFSFNSEQGQTIEHRKLNREEVAACFDIPPPLIGILDRATFSNVTEQHLMLYMDTLGPWLTMIEETLHVQLIAQEPAYADIFSEFDLAEVMKGDMMSRYNALNQAIGGPWMTPNEGRKLENLPAIDDRGADSIARPMNMTALDGRIPSNPGSPVGTPPVAGSNGHRTDAPVTA